MSDNIPLFKVNMADDLNEVINTLQSGMITQGKKVEEFEEELKEYFNYQYILTLNSATSGLTLAYYLLELDKSTDYVISTPLTCFATNSSILSNNLPIIWADTDINTCNIDLDDVKSKININTRVLSFVHWGGNPVDLNKVEELKNYAKNKYGRELFVIEDCAHAFGSEFNSKKLGTYGNICVFSLQAIKHLTSGDGGLIFLPNEELYKKAKLLRWFGIDRERRSLKGSDFRLEPDIPVYGFKYHMNDINATIGLTNLRYLIKNNILEKYIRNGIYYNENLNNIFGIELFNYNNNNKVPYWIYTIKVLFNRKKEFIEFMKEKGIVVSQVHARNDFHSCLLKYRTKLNNLDNIEKQIVSIPVGFWINENERKYIVDCIKEFSQKLQITTLSINDIEEYSRLLIQLNNFYSINKNLSDNSLKSIYVIKLNDVIICSAKLVIEEKLYEPIGHIEDVVTDIMYRGCGYGKHLIKHLIDISFNNFCCYKIVLNCKDDLNDFYSSCGLTKTGLSFSKYKKK
jgi:dTDP-4-amino-4,6-dideoxygalactose transaminase